MGVSYIAFPNPFMMPLPSVSRTRQTGYDSRTYSGASSLYSSASAPHALAHVETRVVAQWVPLSQLTLLPSKGND